MIPHLADESNSGDLMVKISDTMMEELRKMRPEEIYQTLSIMVSELPEPGRNEFAETLQEAIAAGLLTPEQIEKYEREL